MLKIYNYAYDIDYISNEFIMIYHTKLNKINKKSCFI